MNKKFMRYFQIIGLTIFALLLTATIGVTSVEARGKSQPPKYCRYTHYCNYTIVKDGFTYAVGGNATYTRECGKNSFPAWGCDFVKSEIIERIGPASLSQTWGLGCGNVHSYSASIIGGNAGECGRASTTTASYSNAPTTELCKVGAASVVTTNPTNYTWSCTGTYGGATVSCAAPRTSLFTLSCNVSPTTGVVGAPVTFTAGITGTTTPASSFTYTWNLNGTNYSDDNTFQRTFSEASSTINVVVTAVRGNANSTQQCTFNRVDCGPGQVFCGDQPNPTSYSCQNSYTQCPKSYCGTTVATPIYNISADKQLPAGGTLPATPPSDVVVGDLQLCAVNSWLRIGSDGNSTWKFNPSYSAWNWDCQSPGAFNVASCKARCKTGEYYCRSKSRCVADEETCDCSLSGGAGTVNQKDYCVNETDNTCYACGKVIEYFKLKPDEIPKNQTVSFCGALWKTNSLPVSQQPAGTTATRVICELKSGTTITAVAANNETTAIPCTGGVGVQTLTCTQQYQIGAGAWLNLQSSSLDARCRALPAVIEN